MSVSFSSFPANWRLPLVWIEIDPSKAGSLTQNFPALLLGQKLTAGTAPADQPIAIATLAQAKAAFGEGSMLERMCARFFDANHAALLYCVPQVEPAAGAAASGVIAVSAPPTAAGTLNLYIAGQRVQVAIGASDTVDAIAANITSAINAVATLPVTAVQGTSTNNYKVNLTCKWKGASGNDIDLRDSYLGAAGAEILPPGLGLTYTAMSGGSASPSLTNSIAALGDEQYDYVALPYTDSTSLSAIGAEYGFGDSGRWGWMRQSYGTVFSAIRGAYSTLAAAGPNNNYPTISALAIEANSPTPVWEWAASYAAEGARALMNDPARPLQTLELSGCLPAPRGSRFAKTEINNLAGLGFAVQGVGSNGSPVILRECTMYQKNLYGQGDDAYQLVTTLHTLAAILRRLNQSITSKYPRHKLANDGTRFGPGQAIVTPNIIKAELVAEYRGLEFDGLVENVDAFKANLVVERDPNNSNRINVLFPPDLVNQLRTFAVLAQFRLQYPVAV